MVDEPEAPPDGGDPDDPVESTRLEGPRLVEPREAGGLPEDERAVDVPGDPGDAGEPAEPLGRIEAGVPRAGPSDDGGDFEAEHTFTEELPGAAGGGPQLELVPSARLQSIVESLLFAADRPLTLPQLKELLEEPDLRVVRGAVAAVQQALDGRGFVLHEVAGGFQLRTNPDNAAWVQRLHGGRPVKLSRAQLETLAIVAYRQPITRPEIDEIRGVDCGAVLKALLDRSLVRILGKKEEPGRPLLYGTTKDFLAFFNLKDLRELPSLREFHELSLESQAKVDAKAPASDEVALPPAPSVAPFAATSPDLGELDADLDAEVERDLAAALAAADAVGARLEGSAGGPPPGAPAGEQGEAGRPGRPDPAADDDAPDAPPGP